MATLTAGIGFEKGSSEYYAAMQAKVCSPGLADRSPIEIALDRLNTEIGNAGDEFHMLENRLVPVSRQLGSNLSSGSNAEPPSSCLMEDRILSMAKTLASISESLRRTRDQLCI